jgi:hypothetical protein
MTGNVPAAIATHAAVLTGYAVISCYVALVLARRRLLK